MKEECVKDLNGRVLSESNEVCERWRDYFYGLLNVNVSGRAEITARPGMNVRVFEKAIGVHMGEAIRPWPPL